MNNDLMFSTGNNETGTSQEFFKQMEADYGPFGCDVAALSTNKKVESYFGPDHEDPARRDCLKVDWPKGHPNWLNPPYSEPEAPCHPTHCKKKRCATRGWHTSAYIPGCIDFIAKAVEQQREGVSTIILTAARTDTAWFHTYLYDAKLDKFKQGIRVRFLRGRLTFEGHTTPAPFPSLIAIVEGW